VCNFEASCENNDCLQTASAITYGTGCGGFLESIVSQLGSQVPSVPTGQGFLFFY